MSTWPNRGGASGGPCGGLIAENPDSQTAILTIRPARSDSSQQASSKAGAVQAVLEALFEVKLFDRHARGVRPTATCAGLLPIARVLP